MKKLTKNEFINKANEIHSNKYDYSKVNYVNSQTKVCIICPEHGEFWQIPNAHLKGSGCLKCGNIKKSEKERLTTEEFIEKARKIHGDKYDYSKVEYINNYTPVCIICSKHGEFFQKPYNHLNGCGCRICCERKKLTTEEFIKQAREVHGDKYNYSKVSYINTHTKVCIICPEHGEFWQTPNVHLNKHGCPKCCKRNTKYTKEDFVLKARQIHGWKYDYSKVEYVNSSTKVCIICPEHGEFWQTPGSHLSGKGCEKCVRPSYDTESFIKCAKKIHSDKYDYSKVKYVNTKTKVCVVCPEHGEFWVKPNVHLQNCGCDLCLKKNEEKLFLELCSEFGTKYVIRQKTFDWLRNPSTNYHQYIDFYLPKYNVAIELQGSQHFIKNKHWDKNEESFLKRNKLDINKKELCEKNGIKILYFTYENVWNEFLNQKICHTIEEIKKNLNSIL